MKSTSRLKLRRVTSRIRYIQQIKTKLNNHKICNEARISSMRVSFEYKNYRLVETSKSEWQVNKHSTGHKKTKEIQKKQ